MYLNFAIEEAKRNAELNGVLDRMTFTCADVLDLLPKYVEEGRQYDLVILDPPAFTKSRETIKKAAKGYREINIRGLKLVKPGGYFGNLLMLTFYGSAAFY
jgi:SAM-dependent methyltransferase (EC 2.1.1.-)